MDGGRSDSLIDCRASSLALECSGCSGARPPAAPPRPPLPFFPLFPLPRECLHRVSISSRPLASHAYTLNRVAGDVYGEATQRGQFVGH
jgi:hypothetical protein